MIGSIPKGACASAGAVRTDKYNTCFQHLRHQPGSAFQTAQFRQTSAKVSLAGKKNIFFAPAAMYLAEQHAGPAAKAPPEDS
ncbi:hypothetical protein [Roseibium sp.]|uniref:hypothetical protein n=1 Tax=Roseibium sp. TaxID=1936156 RepID=UPI0032643AB8